MKIFSLLLLLFLFASPMLTFAQLKPVNQATKTPASSKTPATPSPQKLSNTSDSLKLALSNVKNSFSSIFKSKRDTISIMIPGIEYDDANLSLLKENLKKVKGVRAVLTQYKSATAVMEVMYKGKSTALWDELPRESKDPFKIVEADDNNITLKYKNNTVH